MAEKIRNVCIIAHVDHGKTTLADFLLASNNILSSRTAGTMRYLDSREDEQYRLITMKSSAISLTYNYIDPFLNASNLFYTINLIDSPGHVDFAHEVSSALRLCDGALILVDVVEGLGDQTRKVLQQAYIERVQMLLVLNKMDRLILELGLTPKEAYSHICKLIEQINVLMHQFLHEEIHQSIFIKDGNFEDEKVIVNKLNLDSKNISDIYKPNIEIIQNDKLNILDNSPEISSSSSHLVPIVDDSVEKSVEFSFSNGNILFTSCLHGWCLDINDGNILKNISDKLELPWCLNTREKLKKALTEGYYFNLKSKSVSQIPNRKDQCTMLEQFILEPLWSIYNSICINYNKSKILKIIEILKIKQTNDLEQLLSECSRQISKDSELLKISSPNCSFSALCRYILSNWLPLASGVFNKVVTFLPSPLAVGKVRLPHICPSLYNLKIGDLLSNFRLSIENCIELVNPNYPVVVYISKFAAADISANRLTGDKLRGTEKLNGFVGISRIFAGTLNIGDKLYICRNIKVELNNKSSTYQGNLQVTVTNIYTLLGNDLIPIETVKAGNIFGLCLEFPQLNNQDYISKNNLNQQHDIYTLGAISCLDQSLTLSNLLNMPSFSSLTETSNGSSAIIRVSIEPRRVQDIPLMVEGLKLLCRSDTSVEVDTFESGEYIIGCRGEVHLERCISDLQQVFARIPLTISSPLVSLREGLTVRPKTQIPKKIQNKIPFPPWVGINPNAQDLHDSKNFSLINDNYTPNSNCETIYDGLDGRQTMRLPNENVIISFNAVSMPISIIEYIEKNRSIINSLIHSHSNLYNYSSSMNHTMDILDEIDNHLTKMINNLIAEKRYNKREKLQNISKYIILGICTRKGSCTILATCETQFDLMGWTLRCTYDSSYYPKKISNFTGELKSFYILVDNYKRIINGIVTGCELASLAGPLCEEPIYGVTYLLENLTFNNNQFLVNISNNLESSNNIKNNNFEFEIDKLNLLTFANLNISNISNQLTTLTKECCRRAILQRGLVRIYEAMLKLTILSEQSVLGKVYSALGRRRANIYKEELKEGTSTFKIEAQIPVVESFGIGQELRNKASGHVSVNMVFSHWKMLDQDPFPEASLTQEDFEDEGFSKVNMFLSPNSTLDIGTDSKSDLSTFNVARNIINSIRKRKGLPTEHKVVIAAEKQRTLKK
ncbi:elongation factor Tu GTP binding domain-containing protein [Cryptosporidium serpentis]